MSAASSRRARTCFLITCVLSSGVLAACAPAEDGPSPVVVENEIVARRLMAAWEAGDVDALVDLFRPDAVYDDFPNSVQHRGLEEVAAYVGHVHTWASDVVMNVTAVHASETGAVAEWVFSAVQTDPIPGRVDVATGREVALNGVTVLEIRGGLIHRAGDYIDVLPLVLQLGARVEMPGGRIMDLSGVR